MGFLDSNLIPGERVIFKTRLHSIILVGPIFIAAILSAPAAYCLWRAFQEPDRSDQTFKILCGAAALLFLLALISIIRGLVRRNSTEIGVTNRRVLMKWGVASRKTLEIPVQKVESTEVLQSFWGRALGYGTIIVRGTGGTPEPVHKMARPVEFRRALQEQIQAGLAPPQPVNPGPG
ncbi:MAG TPA: PH domain-containing protein [Candidatus Acidoferrales bacterium]|nr:PH domain-containing protein [Candidatus Acidoferrales bacterium]